MSEPMTENEFNRAASIYGGAIQQWPIALQSRAAAFAQQAPKRAHAILASQSDVDSALSHAPKQSANPALEAKILRSFEEHKPVIRPLYFLQIPKAITNMITHPARAIPAWSIAFTLLLAFGFSSGYVGYANKLSTAQSTDIIANAFGSDESTLFTEDIST